MKQVSYINSFGKHPIEGEVNININRELTQDEQSIAHGFLESFVRVLNRNTITSSEEFKAQCAEERKELLACFPSLVYVKEVPSEYGNLEPWYEVTTSKGIITIGWRHSVISIDWSKSDILYFGEVLFKGEEVTGCHSYEHNTQYIHAYGYEKAKEYIKKLLL